MAWFRLNDFPTNLKQIFFSYFLFDFFFFFNYDCEIRYRLCTTEKGLLVLSAFFFCFSMSRLFSSSLHVNCVIYLPFLFYFPFNSKYNPDAEQSAEKTFRRRHRFIFIAIFLPYDFIYLFFCCYAYF